MRKSHPFPGGFFVRPGQTRQVSATMRLIVVVVILVIIFILVVMVIMVIML
jgi:hypothetical protein